MHQPARKACTPLLHSCRKHFQNATHSPLPAPPPLPAVCMPLEVGSDVRGRVRAGRQPCGLLMDVVGPAERAAEQRGQHTAQARPSQTPLMTRTDPAGPFVHAFTRALSPQHPPARSPNPIPLSCGCSLALVTHTHMRTYT